MRPSRFMFCPPQHERGEDDNRSHHHAADFPRNEAKQQSDDHSQCNSPNHDHCGDGPTNQAHYEKADSDKQSGKLGVQLHHPPRAGMSLGSVIFHRLIVPPVHAENHHRDFRLLINPHSTHRPRFWQRNGASLCYGLFSSTTNQCSSAHYIEGMSCAIRSSSRTMLRIPTVRLVSGEADLMVVTNHVSDRKNIMAAIAGLNSCENPCLRTPRTRNTRPARPYVPYIKSCHRRPTICSGGSNRLLKNYS